MNSEFILIKKNIYSANSGIDTVFISCLWQRKDLCRSPKELAVIKQLFFLPFAFYIYSVHRLSIKAKIIILSKY